jgi:hypothetical protein
MAIIIAILIIAAGGFFLSRGIKRISLASASSSWPTAKGKIVESLVKQHRDTTTTKNEYSYFPIVSYTYEVNGQMHNGSEVRYGKYKSYAKEHDARFVISPYPVGKEVTVSYQPDDPTVCVLEPGYTNNQLIGPVISGGICALGLFLLVNAFKPQAAKQNQEPVA